MSIPVSASSAACVCVPLCVSRQKAMEDHEELEASGKNIPIVSLVSARVNDHMRWTRLHVKRTCTQCCCMRDTIKY